jgi:cyanophycinase
LIDGVIIDQHFVRRKRHNRLISLVLEGPPHLAAGIDESTALVVRPDGSWEVRGASVVVIYDARRAGLGPVAAARDPLAQVRDPVSALAGTGILMHVLPAGGRFDPATGRATLP